MYSVTLVPNQFLPYPNRYLHLSHITLTRKSEITCCCSGTSSWSPWGHTGPEKVGVYKGPQEVIKTSAQSHTFCSASSWHKPGCFSEFAHCVKDSRAKPVVSVQREGGYTTAESRPVPGPPVTVHFGKNIQESGLFFHILSQQSCFR